MHNFYVVLLLHFAKCVCATCFEFDARFMAKVCPVTKKGSRIGGGYSNRTRATQFNPTGKSRKYPNLQKKRIYIPELKRSITLTLSAKGIKTLQKQGVYRTLKKAGVI